MDGWIRAVEGCVRVGVNCLKYLKGGWNRKKGRRKKDFKKWGQVGSSCGCLKMGVPPPGGTPITNYCTHSLNILLERIERNTFFKIGEQFNVFFISNSLQRKMIDWSCMKLVKHMCKSLVSEGWALWVKLDTQKNVWHFPTLSAKWYRP